MTRRLIVALLLFAAAISVSVVGYRISRDSTNQQSYFGDFDEPNRVEVNAWITRVDPTKQLLALTINSVQPFGTAADQDGNFAADATLTASAIGNWKFPVKAGDAATDDDLQVVIFGPVTDYPFDRYDSRFEVHVVGADDKELPVALTVLNTDAFFDVGTANGESDTGGTVVDLSIRRSPSTLVFAISIMVLMLGLAAAAATAAYYVLNGKRGLVFPACSLMAAMLFALIPLRNAVPGNPPIGSIIDFGSFFIAEAVIAISLISCIMLGYRQQSKIDAVSD